jgi:hypothetical protein
MPSKNHDLHRPEHETMKNLIQLLREWHGTDFDQEAWNFGNCFRLRREATQVRGWMKECLANFHREHEEELAQRLHWKVGSRG